MIQVSKSALTFSSSVFLTVFLASDGWMDLLTGIAGSNEDVEALEESLFKELDEFLDGKLVSRVACPNIIIWWGVSRLVTSNTHWCLRSFLPFTVKPIRVPNLVSHSA